MLILKIYVSGQYDGKRKFIYDNTQDYIDGDKWGWGRGDTPVNRADRALVTFTKKVDIESAETYIKTDQGYDAYFHVAPGSGLTNTDKSRFDFISEGDYHYRYFLYPAVQAASAPSVSLNGVYYDTAESKLKFSDGTVWRDFVYTDLAAIESKSDTATCEQIWFVDKIILLNLLKRKAYPLGRPCDESYVGLVDKLENYLFIIGSAFKEGKKATARKFLQHIEDEYHEFLQ